MHRNLKIAINAALEAGEAIMKIYEAPITVEYKDDKSPLTQADKEANTIINKFLIPTDIPIISEENKQKPYNERKNWQQCWIVDPVDGTKEFIKRNGEFTVNIAFIDKGTPKLGVIYIPATKTVYYADVDQNKAYKATLNHHKTNFNEVLNLSKEIHPKTRTNSIKIVGSRSHMNDDTLAFMDQLKAQGKDIEIVSKGSSIKFCLVAEGNADIYPRFAPTMEWDTAAGQAICNAVGISVISKDTNKPMEYNRENLLNSYFIVEN